MITGAASSEAALLLIDAAEGVREQSRRHGYLLHLLGVDQVAVLINKMDLVGYSAERFGVAEEYREYLAGLGVSRPASSRSRRAGRRHRPRSKAMRWYQGPTVLEALDQFVPGTPPVDLPLRLPIQDVYKFDQRRILVGRIASGRLAVGDELVFSPSNKTAKVKSIEGWSVPELPSEAVAGSRSGSRSRTRSSSSAARSRATASSRRSSNVFRARVFWLGHAPLEPGNRYTLKLNTRDRRHGAVDRERDRHRRSVGAAGGAARAQRRRRGGAAHPRPCSRWTSTAPIR